MTNTATEVKKSHAIIRGRIPLAVVFLIRFVDSDKASKELAEKYATTVGKVDDIKKNRNFAYVTEDVRFTEDQKAEAVTYITQHEDADTAALVIDQIGKLETATKEEAEAFASVKRKNGGQDRTDAEGKVIEAGGGNRQGKAKKAKDETPSDTAAEGEATPAADPAPEDLMDV